MKTKYEHLKMSIPLNGWVEYDIKKIKRHWWSSWETVMETTSCPMLYNIKCFDENGKEFSFNGNHSFDSITDETSD